MPLIPPDVRAFQASLPPIEPVKMETPDDWRQRAATIAALEAETRNRDALAKANAIEARQRERAMADEDAMRRIATDAKGDWDVLIERATALNPELGAKLTKQRGDARAATAEAFTKELAAEQKRTERALSFLTVAQNDPELYDRIAPNIAALLPEELQAAMPRTHDPVKIGFLLEVTGDAKARMERAAKLHDQVLSGDAFKGVLGQLAEQDTEEEWNGVIQTYAAFLPKGTLALLPKWGPDAPAKAAAMAMTPAQKADDARQVVGQQITLAGQAESQRHNRAMEGHAAATERRLAAGGGDNGPLQAIIGPDGQPVLVARRDAIGKRPATGTAGTGTGKVPAGIALQVAGVEQSLAVLDKMEQNLPTSMLGPIAGRWTKFSADAPGVPVPAPVAKYLAEEATLRNAVIKATTGAAMSEPEAKRIMEQIPDITNKPERWKANAQATRENLSLLRQRMLELSGVSGDMPVPASKTAPSGTKRRDIKGGGVAELRNGKWIRVE